ncbi:MAG: PA2778 family cysteine peptidase [Porticoccaceae bacterium]
MSYVGQSLDNVGQSPHKLLRVFSLCVLLSLTVSACSHRPSLLNTPPYQSIAQLELSDVPFFPQREYQCGPAALTTIMQYAGSPVSLETLTEQVYLPDRQGSLQYELLAAVRRSGLVAYTLDTELSAILDELRLGRPVLVLQNLGLDIYPIWHYAVVIGFDAERNVLILRSGTEHRKTISLRSFLKTWHKAKNWAFVALQPGQFPHKVNRQRYLSAVTALEGVSPPEATLAAFKAAAERWPLEVWALTGLANALYASGDSLGAERTFRHLLRLQPEHAVAHNNLAHLLNERGCYADALIEIEKGFAGLNNNHPLYMQLQETRTEVISARDRINNRTAEKLFGEQFGCATPNGQAP